ncbi:MAG: CAP domain-containing protein [Mycobacteriales bacterium]
MQLRSLSVAVLAAILLVPVSGTAAHALGTSSVSTVQSTFKNSAVQKAKRSAWASRVPQTGAVTAPTPVASYADRVLTLTNRERTSRGLRALSFSGCADGYADSWARSLAKAGVLSHQPLAPILTACRARAVGENVAYGNHTPEQLVQRWMASPGHRANILTAGFTHLGVGDVTTSTGRVYAVQVFLTL